MPTRRLVWRVVGFDFRTNGRTSGAVPVAPAKVPLRCALKVDGDNRGDRTAAGLLPTRFLLGFRLGAHDAALLTTITLRSGVQPALAAAIRANGLSTYTWRASGSLQQNLD